MKIKQRSNKMFIIMIVFGLILATAMTARYYKSVGVDAKSGFDAVKSGAPIRLYTYLRKGGESNLITKENNSLLASALNTPFSCMKVNILLRYGAIPDLVYEVGYNTPLLDAVSWLDYCSAKLLLEGGADISYKDKNNHSVYDYLGRGNSKARKDIKDLLDKYHRK